ncbi:hypothetical protein FQN49_004197 [Arthroderma sp. PD_2]|nr:hypothetical protein FQN49_004197 [Arthroderma sp. PD_2]
MVNKNILATIALAGLASAKTVEVKVGDGGLTFDPNTIMAEVNDQIHFKFAGGPHDVSSSSFDNPCKPAENALYSGELNEGGEFLVNVTSTDPVWLYCSISKHCSKGMTAVINPPSSGDSLMAYTDAAKGAGRGEAPSTVNDGNGGSGTPTTSSGAPAATTTNAASSLTFSGAAAVVAMGAWFGLL